LADKWFFPPYWVSFPLCIMRVEVKSLYASRQFETHDRYLSRDTASAGEIARLEEDRGAALWCRGGSIRHGRTERLHTDKCGLTPEISTASNTKYNTHDNRNVYSQHESDAYSNTGPRRDTPPPGNHGESRADLRPLHQATNCSFTPGVSQCPFLPRELPQ